MPMPHRPVAPPHRPGAASAPRARSGSDWPRRLAAVLLLLAPGAAGALTVIGIEPAARTDAERSCYELAAEIEELTRVHGGSPGFWSRTDNRVAGVMSAITPIAAFGYIGYNAYRAFKQDERAEAAATRIDALRRHSARKSCFVR